MPLRTLKLIDSFTVECKCLFCVLCFLRRIIVNISTKFHRFRPMKTGLFDRARIIILIPFRSHRQPRRQCTDTTAEQLGALVFPARPSRGSIARRRRRRAAHPGASLRSLAIPSDHMPQNALNSCQRCGVDVFLLRSLKISPFRAESFQRRAVCIHAAGMPSGINRLRNAAFSSFKSSPCISTIVAIVASRRAVQFTAANAGFSAFKLQGLCASSSTISQ